MSPVLVLAALASSGTATAAPPPNLLAPELVDGGQSPRSLAAADLDGDGLDDLVVVNARLGITVVLGPDTPSPTKRSYATGGDPVSSVLADLDGDGDLDLAVADFRHDAMVRLNDGSGRFLAPTWYPAGPDNTAIGAADLDNDGDLDLVLNDIGANGNLAVLLGNGNGTFGAYTTFPTGGDGAASFAAGDIDGDGDVDLVATDRGDDGFSVLLGNGNGTFAAAVVHSNTSPVPVGMALVDFDGDGKLDLALESKGFRGPRVTVSVLLGDGAGGFTPSVTFAPSGYSQPDRLLAVDLDNDGALDLWAGEQVGWGRGNGRFDGEQRYALIDAGADGTATGDFNGDGLLDLAACSRYYSAPEVLIAHGLGGRAFAAATWHDEVNPGGITLGDMDGDGAQDVVVRTVSGMAQNALQVFRNAPVGRGFAGPDIYAAFTGTRAPAIGDLDGDGVLDLFAADSFGYGVYVGDGAGGLRPPTHVGGSPSGFAAHLADLDGDGDLDVAFADNNNDAVGVLLGNGNATFGPVTLVPTGVAPIALAVGDLDGDGDQDAVTTHTDLASQESVDVLLGNGNATFGPPVSYLLGAGGDPANVSLADLNLDGNLDVLVARYTGGSGELSVLLGTAGGGLAPSIEYPAGGSTLEVGSGDFNADGFPDVVVTNSGVNGDVETIGVFVGDGTGTLAPMVALPDAGCVDMGVADMNGDGLDDVVGASSLGFELMFQTP